MPPKTLPHVSPGLYLDTVRNHFYIKRVYWKYLLAMLRSFGLSQG